MTLLLALTACFVRYEPIRDAARAERQESVRAEDLWEDVLDEPLLVGEWRQARRRLCGLRSDRIEAQAATLNLQTVAPDDIGALRQAIVGCPHSGALLAELTALEQRAAVRELDALVTADLPPYPSLLRAQDLAPHVLAEHPIRATLQRWRTEWTAQLAEARQRFPSPVYQSFIGEIERDAGVSAGPPFQQVVDAALAHHLGRMQVVADDSCRAFAPASYERTGDGTPVEATVTLRNCAASDRRGQVKVAYQVTKYRTEQQQVPHRHTVRTATTVANVNCYYSIQAGQTLCSHVGTYTEYDTETTTTYTTEQVQVPYQETQYRLEDRFTKTVKATVQVAVQTPDGSQTLPARTVQDAITGTSTPAAARAYDALLRPVLVTLGDEAVAAGRALHVDRLARDANLETPDGIEARLLAHGADRKLSPPELERLATVAGLPVEALSAARRPLGDFAPRDPSGTPLAYVLPDVEDGLVRYGFSPLMYTVGFGHTDGGDFEAHHSPRSLGLHVNAEFNGSLSTGRAANGFAVHAMPVVDLHVGWRLNKAHTFTEVALGSVDNDREPRSALGFRGGLGALVGYRNTGFGLFAGVLPQAHFALGGFYKNGGSTLPLAVRLELRPVPRRPMLVNAWGGNLLDRDSRDYGVRLSLPVGERIWLTAEQSRNTGRTELLGLHDQDRLDGGRRPYTRTFGGITYGF